MRALTATALLVLALPVAPSHAAQAYDNCVGFIDSLPAVISTQGTWCLRKDLGTASNTGTAIEIRANNVTLDCNDFKVGGLAAGMATAAFGVVATDRSNATVRNCNLRGFRRGLMLLGQGQGHLVERNRLEGNTSIALTVSGDNSIIRENQVLDTGGSPDNAGTIGILAIGQGIAVVENTVAGVETAPLDVPAYGIYLNGEGFIGGNRVSGLAGGASWGSIAIQSDYSRALVHGNALFAPPDGSDSFGILCQSSIAIARSNSLTGFTSPVSASCTSSGNVIAGN